MMTSGSARTIERSPDGKRQAGLQVHLDLCESGNLVLDRILDRDDVHLGLVDHVQRRVEARGLARPGRPRDEGGAVGLA